MEETNLFPVDNDLQQRFPQKQDYSLNLLLRRICYKKYTVEENSSAQTLLLSVHSFKKN